MSICETMTLTLKQTTAATQHYMRVTPTQCLALRNVSYHQLRELLGRRRINWQKSSSRRISGMCLCYIGSCTLRCTLMDAKKRPCIIPDNKDTEDMSTILGVKLQGHVCSDLTGS